MLLVIGIFFKSIYSLPSMHMRRNERLQLRKNTQLAKDLNVDKKAGTWETPINQTIIRTDKDVFFYNGIKSKALLNKFLDYIKFSLKKPRDPSIKSSIVRRFRNPAQKTGPKSKLSDREEFLLRLMKIRLGFLNEDLANRFTISKHQVVKYFLL